jgi:cytochrome oxidase assembly protein ShyY1
MIHKLKQAKTTYLIYGLGGLAVFSATNVLANYWGEYAAEEEIAYRKSQLQKPLYVLSEAELKQLPWNRDNLREWLYRPLLVRGRMIHANQISVPRELGYCEGLLNLVPFVTFEEGDERHGVVLNRGWLPFDKRNQYDRSCIESASRTEVVAYLSELKDAAEGGLRGNNKGMGSYYLDNRFTHADLQDMADVTGFRNQDCARLAALEAVDIDERTRLDERESAHFNKEDVLASQPARRTLAGALQLDKMPW